MRSVALLLFGIHLAFADPFSIRCEDETGSVGDRFTLTCIFSDQEHVCCKKSNKFSQIASNDSSTICKGEFSTDPCVKMTNFSCFYTANSPMPKTFKIFMETKCESIRRVIKDNDRGSSVCDCSSGNIWSLEIIIAAGCVLPLIVFAVIMGVIVWMKSSQVKRLLKGCVLGSTTNADSVSDQEMQNHSSSMEVLPPNF